MSRKFRRGKTNVRIILLGNSFPWDILIDIRRLYYQEVQWRGESYWK